MIEIPSDFPLFAFTSLYFVTGQGLLSQSALQLNSQDAYAAAGYHSNQGMMLGETVAARSGQVGGAVHSYNQVNVSSFFFLSLILFHLSTFPHSFSS